MHKDEFASVPSCDKHGPMTLLPPGTKEQASCGTWYACQNPWPRCNNAVLVPSGDLLAQLDKQRCVLARTRQPQGARR